MEYCLQYSWQKDLRGSSPTPHPHSGPLGSVHGRDPVERHRRADNLRAEISRAEREELQSEC